MDVVSQSSDISNYKGQEINAPKLIYKKDKWANIGRRGIADVATAWQGNENLVKIIDDSKLKGDSLVMLKKSTFETMQKLLTDLQEGQIGLEYNIETVMRQISILVEVAKLQKPNDALGEVIKSLEHMTTRISTKFVVANSPRKIEPPKFSEEELQSVDDLED